MRARYVLLATRRLRRSSGLPGRELAITSDDAFHLARLPRRVTLVGGGYIGLEFACIFRALGRAVHAAHHGEQSCRASTATCAITSAHVLGKPGIDLHCGVEASASSAARRTCALTLSDGSSRLDVVLFAIGRRRARRARARPSRRARSRGRRGGGRRLGRTSLAHVFAVGDCNGARAHAGRDRRRSGRGTHAVRRAPRRIDHEHTPTAVFSLPPVARVGLREHEARVRQPRVDVYRSEFLPLKHTLSGRAEQTLVKLVVDRANQRVLGCHMVGQDAPEVIQGLALALRLGATKEDFDATIGVHPTIAEELVTLRASARRVNRGGADARRRLPALRACAAG